MVIKNDQGVQVLLRDIASIKDTTKEVESISRLNGRRAVGLDLVKQSGANEVDVAAAVKARLAELKRRCRPTLKLQLRLTSRSSRKKRCMT